MSIQRTLEINPAANKQPLSPLFNSTRVPQLPGQIQHIPAVEKMQFCDSESESFVSLALEIIPIIGGIFETVTRQIFRGGCRTDMSQPVTPAIKRLKYKILFQLLFRVATTASSKIK